MEAAIATNTTTTTTTRTGRRRTRRRRILVRRGLGNVHANCKDAGRCYGGRGSGCHTHGVLHLHLHLHLLLLLVLVLVVQASIATVPAAGLLLGGVVDPASLLVFVDGLPLSPRWRHQQQHQHQPSWSPNKARTRTRLKARPFSEFEFAPNGVCINPSVFVEESEEEEEEETAAAAEEEGRGSSSSSSSPSSRKKQKKQKQRRLFTMRNVPGDGDCMFLAVALASLTSFGLGANDALLRAISQETRNVVAQVLSQPNGARLYVDSGSGTAKGGGGGGGSSQSGSSKSGKRPPPNVVCASALLEQATRDEGLEDTDQYLGLLKKQGRDGGLYGGGPELVVLSNVLRRPIAIYEPAVPPPPAAAAAAAAAEGDDNDTLDAGPAAAVATTDDSYSYIPIVCVGVFGEGLFEDPCLELGRESAVLQAAAAAATATATAAATSNNYDTGASELERLRRPVVGGAYSWKLHILVLETGVVTKDGRHEKHACVLLPQPLPPPRP